MSSKCGILLLHGLTGVPSEMRPVEKALQKLGYETVAATLAGHGSTNDELLNVQWQQWIDSAQQALDELSGRVDEVVVCGLSMGASICSILAARNEKIRGLIMLSPTLCYDSPEIDAKLHLRIYKSQLVRDIIHVLCCALPAVGKLMYWTETPPYGLKDERLQRQITKAIEAAKRGEDTKFGLFRTYFISLAQMNFITDAFRQSAASVKCPTLIISSLEDTLVSINNAADTYAMLGTTDKYMAMLTGCDHVLTLDLKRNYVSSLIGEFMEALTGNSAKPAFSDDMELSVEIHNRLNPLSNAEWPQLVPGAPSLAAFVEQLQAQSMHETQCHTLVVRKNNQPVLMLPMVMDRGKATVLLGFNEADWGKASSAACSDPQTAAVAWQLADRVLKGLFTSFSVTKKSFATLPVSDSSCAAEVH
jgi:carboxylesterase